jgi:hypothetical protein
MSQQNIVRLAIFGARRAVIIVGFATTASKPKIIIAYGSITVSGGGITGTSLLSPAAALFSVLFLPLQALDTACDINLYKVFRSSSRFRRAGCPLRWLCTESLLPLTQHAFGHIIGT